MRSLRRAKKRAEKEERTLETLDDNVYPMVFSELVKYIHEQHLFSDSSVQPPVFRLCELKTIYSQRLMQMGIKEPDVNETRLKEQLLFHISQLESYRKGREVLRS